RRGGRVLEARQPRQGRIRGRVGSGRQLRLEPGRDTREPQDVGLESAVVPVGETADEVPARGGQARLGAGNGDHQQTPADLVEAVSEATRVVSHRAPPDARTATPKSKTGASWQAVNRRVV